jgi:hypothetical protein
MKKMIYLITFLFFFNNLKYFYCQYCPNIDFTPNIDCTGFYRCANGFKTLKICPDGLLFDNQTKSCNWRTIVKCSNLNLEIRTTSISTITKTIEQKKTTQLESTQSIIFELKEHSNTSETFGHTINNIIFLPINNPFTVINQTTNVHHSKEKKLNKNEFKQNNVTSKELLENYMINYKNFYKNNSKINEKIKKEKLKKGIGNSSIESITSIFDINQGTLVHRHNKTENFKEKNRIDPNAKTKQKLNVQNNKKKQGIIVDPGKKSFKEKNLKTINVNKNESNIIEKMKNKIDHKQRNVTSKELLWNYLKNYKIIYLKDKNLNQKVSKYNDKKEKLNKTIEKSLENTKFSHNKFKHLKDRKHSKKETKPKINFHQYNLKKKSNWKIKKMKNEIEQNNKK